MHFAAENLVWRTVYDYDNAGRVIQKSVPIGTITYTYDETGALVGMQSTAGHDLRYEYNQRGQLAKVYQNGELLSELDYDVAGRLASRTHGPSATSTYTYDFSHQPTDVVTETAGGDYTQTYTYYDDGFIE